jgi:N-acetylneuraminate synthase/sialic acid synthase
MRQFSFRKTVITDDSAPLVIAEIGHNHQGNLETALSLIRAAAYAGASAVKFQKRSNRDLFTEKGYNAPYSSENAFGETYGLHRDALELNSEHYKRCADEAEKLGLVFFSTAFDFQSVDFLMSLNMPLFKVASGDIRSWPLLEYIASTGVPTIFSTGGANFQDIVSAHEIFEGKGTQHAILQCTAGYPPKYEELNLSVIPVLREKFPQQIIGYSGHDNGIAMATAAFALGARIVEKHFTLDRTMKGTDHAFSLEPEGMRKLVRDLNRTRLALGDGEKKTYESERAPVTKMSKSIVSIKKLVAGHQISADDLAYKSPGVGMTPNRADELIGRTLVKDVEIDHLFDPSDVE